MATSGGYYTDEDDFDDYDTLGSMVTSFKQVRIKETENDYIPVKNIQIASRAVCEVKNGLSRGGGFLVRFKADGMNKYGLFTANHVLPKEDLDGFCTFDLKFSKFDPATEKTEPVELNINNIEYYYTRKKPVDATFILLDKKQRDECRKKELCFLQIGYVYKLKEAPTIFMIHNLKKITEEFSGYKPKEIEQTHGVGKYIKEKDGDIYHTVSTKKGSSGSPIIRQDGKVVAIHKKGGDGAYNIGVKLREIVNEITEELKFFTF